MSAYKYVTQEMYCEQVPLSVLAQTYGTPLYIYSYHNLVNNYLDYSRSLRDINHLICYSVKANSNLTLLKILNEMGAGFDIVSGEELQRLLHLGVVADKIVYSGVGKSREEIALALQAKIFLFNVESEDELLLINQIAEEQNQIANIAFRVNPEVDARTHPYITTGLKENKFGITFTQALGYSEMVKSLNWVRLIGVDCHIGSQITELEPFLLAFRKLKQLYQQLTDKGFTLKILDIGGGLGISYTGKTVPQPGDLMAALITELSDFPKVTLIVEPGRSIIASSGVILSTVLYSKSREGKNFLIVDAGMNNLLRPSLYNAYHEIKPVVLSSEETMTYDVVGPLCETGDFLGKERTLPPLKSGQLVVILDTGAYGFCLASNYNSKPKAAEVLVKDSSHYLIRNRDNFTDIIHNENIVKLY